MNYKREQLIEALCDEYAHLCEDDFNEVEDDSPEKYRASVEKLTVEELIQLTTTGKDFTLDEFVDLYPR